MADVAGRLREFFGANAPDVVAAYLFGSEARGEATGQSDVDVAVLFAVPPSSTLTGPVLSLQADLEQVLGRRVDAIDLHRAPADLVHRVLRDGQLVCDRNRSLRIRFEVQRRNEFFDMELFRRRYRRQSEPVPS